MKISALLLLLVPIPAPGNLLNIALVVIIFSLSTLMIVSPSIDDFESIKFINLQLTFGLVQRELPEHVCLCLSVFDLLPFVLGDNLVEQGQLVACIDYIDAELLL